MERPSKRARGAAAGASARREIDLAAGRSDTDGALAVWRSAKLRGEALQLHTYNVLLHLCASAGRDADATAVFADLQAAGPHCQPNECSYTEMARVSAAAGDPPRALKWTRDCRAAGLVPRLRTYAPALQAFARAGDSTAALGVEAEMRENGEPLGGNKASAGGLLPALLTPRGRRGAQRGRVRGTAALPERSGRW